MSRTKHRLGESYESSLAARQAMSGHEIFESAVGPRGDLAGVFESDGEASYFYLYKTDARGEEVLDSIHVASGCPDFTSSDIAIRWTQDGGKVGLFIKGDLWAIFDAERGTKHGGNYRAQGRPALEPGACDGFFPA
jgi:hypothetical protein